MSNLRLIFTLRDDPNFVWGKHWDNRSLHEIPVSTVALTFEGSSIDDEAFLHLPFIPSLRCLDLDNSNISDISLLAISSLPELEELWLECTRITDAGLMHLQSCNSLRFVSVAYTAVTEAGIAKLTAAVPDIEVST